MEALKVFKLKHEKKFKFLILVFYIGFLACWSIWLSLQQAPSDSHSIEDSIEGIFRDTEFANNKRFNDIENELEVWKWMEKVLVPGLWTNTLYPSTTPTDIVSATARGKEDSYVRKFNYAMGAVITQTRYNKTLDCLFAEIKLPCYKSLGPALSNDYKSNVIDRSDLATVEGAFTFSAEGAEGDDEFYADGYYFADDPDAVPPEFGVPTADPGATFPPTASFGMDVPTPAPTGGGRKRRVKGAPQRVENAPRMTKRAVAAVGLEDAFKLNAKTQDYRIYLDPDFSVDSAIIVLSTMQDFMWIDKETEQIKITMPFFNVNFGIFLKYDLIIDFTPGGSLKKKTVSSFAVPLSSKDAEYPTIIAFTAILIGSIVFLITYQAFIIFSLFRESFKGDGSAVAKLMRFGVKMISDFWQLLNLASLCLMIVVMSMYAAMQSMMSDVTTKFAAAVSGDTSLDEVTQLVAEIEAAADTSTAFQMFAVLTTLCLFLNGIRFFDLSPTMGMLAETLGRAGPSLASFTILFIFLFTSFAVMGHITFGSTINEFSTFPNAVMACATLLFGAGIVEYADMKTASPVLAPLFFVLFFLLTVLVLTNVFIAILAEYYQVAKEKREKEAVEAKEKVAAKIEKIRSKRLTGAAGGGDGDGGGGGGDIEMAEQRANKGSKSPPRSPRSKSPRKKKPVDDVDAPTLPPS